MVEQGTAGLVDSWRGLYICIKYAFISPNIDSPSGFMLNYITQKTVERFGTIGTLCKY